MSVICYLAAGVLNLLWLSIGDVLPVNEQLLVPCLTAALVCVGVLVRTRHMSVQHRSAYRRRALWVLLLYYIAILSVLLFFGGLFHVDRVWGGAVNLKPFYTIRRFLIHYRHTGSLSSLSNLLGNVVLLLPLGILLPAMFRPMRRAWLFLPVMALVCVGVEALQWSSGRGIADVDDSILNFVGTAAGWLLTRVCQLLCRHSKGAKNE